MLWESLVTEGHVRAARLRRLQPWLIALGLILIWLGIWIARSGPSIGANASFMQSLQQRLQDLRMHADRTAGSLPQPVVPPAEMKRLPPARELAAMLVAVRRSLVDSNDLPEDDIDFKEVDVDEFWKGAWPLETVVYSEDDDTYVFGAIVNLGNEQYPRPARWLGAAKRMKNGWEVSTLAAGNGVNAVENVPTAQPSQLALSLEDLLPEQPEPVEPDQAPNQ